MPEGMEGVPGGVQLHLLQPELKPFLKLVVENRPHVSLIVAGLEQGCVRTDFRVLEHAPEGVDRSDGTQGWAVVVPCQWNLLDSLRVLDGFSLV